ncbi:hypothetical protein CWO89_11520 [Bradyrhizobium sp. Leo170]|nr:hypothetical protein CWO89_11520 [Bradyrhizobium sp. Leo170]
MISFTPFAVFSTDCGAGICLMPEVIASMRSACFRCEGGECLVCVQKRTFAHDRTEATFFLKPSPPSLIGHGL